MKYEIYNCCVAVMLVFTRVTQGNLSLSIAGCYSCCDPAWPCESSMSATSATVSSPQAPQSQAGHYTDNISHGSPTPTTSPPPTPAAAATASRQELVLLRELQS